VSVDETTRAHEPTLPDEWELVVGLEVHCELHTATKLFCGCPNLFGDEPNTNVCPVCLGLPGSLPVINERAVELAMTLGRALGCEVQGSIFARKNYFYPDMPKDYQVTQYDQPTNVEGSLELPDGTVIRIERAHIEEDTGKSTHVGGDGRISSASHSLVDYNRAGVPLVEIVSGPDIATIDQAKAYVTELRDILLATGTSDAKMEEGSMRVDANVSVRPRGSDELRTRCEIKNVNSVRSIGRAIEYEAKRHVGLYEAGDAPRQETRHWDEAGGRTRSGRSKEDADDYRYFAEPDLLPVVPTPEAIAAIDAAMPTLPSARRRRLVELGVEAADAALVVERGDDDYAIGVVEAGAPAGAVAKHLANNLVEGPGALGAEAFADLIAREAGGEVSSNQARALLAHLAEHGGDVASAMETLGFESVDTGELEALVDGLITEHPDEWARFREGDPKIGGFFVGKVMKATQGQADGKVVNDLLRQRADA
jgi:aspartyl-tRNA(Asn)/glutamyl-tRNA(Gln) amidotransferase subunit B